VTTDEDVLARLTRLLGRVGVPYMVAGSMASTYHGTPRTTHDADVVIDPSPEALDRLVQELEAAGFYVDPDIARQALRSRRQFNAIDTASAFELDLIIRKDRPFSREEFARRQPARLSEVGEVQVATAEDTILAKLEWAMKAGGSERQMDDVRGILAVKGPSLDREYIRKWAATLGVLEPWERLAGEESEA
jgi:acetolactate synthase regulatory subunit